MKIKRLAIILAVVLALGGAGLAFAAFNQAPTPADLLTRAVTTLKSANNGHAVVQVNMSTTEKQTWASVEVWAAKIDDSRYKFRAEVKQSDDAKLQGTTAVSDGTTFWSYVPISNTVYTGPVDQMDKAGLAGKTPDQIVQQLLDYAVPSIVGQDTIIDHVTYEVKLTPNDKAPAAAAGMSGNLWIDPSTNQVWQATVDGGSMGKGQITAQSVELNVQGGLPESLFTFQVPAGAKVVNVQDLKPQHLTLDEAIKSAGFPLLQPGYTPAGSTLVDVLKSGKTIVLKYEMPRGSFAITESAEAGSGRTPSGQSVQVRGVTATIVPQNGGANVLLLWAENGRRYSIGGLSQAEALKVAESLR